MRVLIVEDEPAIRSHLKTTLEHAGFMVDEASNGQDGLFILQEYPVTAAIVDLGLPKLSGLELIRRARAAGRNQPILILTARDQWQDKVEGLEAGADDYLAKPFHPEELLARMRALIRRLTGNSSSVLQVGPLQLDPAQASASLAGQPLELTAYEFRLLEYLMLNASRVVSKQELGDYLYEHDDEKDSNVVEVLMGRLRRKIDPEGQRGLIQTLRGRGYKMQVQTPPPAGTSA